MTVATSWTQEQVALAQVCLCLQQELWHAQKKLERSFMAILPEIGTLVEDAACGIEGPATASSAEILLVAIEKKAASYEISRKGECESCGTEVVMTWDGNELAYIGTCSTCGDALSEEE
jgi:hypothetical protein